MEEDAVQAIEHFGKPPQASVEARWPRAHLVVTATVGRPSVACRTPHARIARLRQGVLAMPDTRARACGGMRLSG